MSWGLRRSLGTMAVDDFRLRGNLRTMTFDVFGLRGSLRTLSAIGSGPVFR
jgi:hypothetical protein